MPYRPTAAETYGIPRTDKAPVSAWVRRADERRLPAHSYDRFVPAYTPRETANDILRRTLPLAVEPRREATED